MFTNISPDAGARLTGCVRFNILQLLLKFAHWKGLGREVSSINVLRNEAIELQELPPSVPETLNPKAVDPFHAAIWLQTKCKEEASNVITLDEFYLQYCHYCALHVFNPITMPELLKLTTKFFKESSISAEHGVLLGVKLSSVEKESMETPMSFDCGILNCTEQFETYQDLKEHVLQHNNRGVSCTWKKCGLNCKNKKRLSLHQLTHLPQPSTAVESQPKQKPLLISGINDGFELKGIPLCAILVIRNIAKNPQNHHLFAPFEKELASFLALPLFSKTVASVFVELRAN